MKAILALEDGTLFEGTSIGVPGEAIGEVVFTTAMSGFQEALTDPCYHGMLLSFTDPVVDNYGVNEEDNESECVQCRGVIMKDPSETPSNFRCKGSMPDFLAKAKIVGISDIDTRMLTRKLRDEGTMRGIITTADPFDFDAAKAKLLRYEQSRPLYEVAAKKEKKYEPNGEALRTIALLDLGVKNSVIAGLTADGARVIRFPASAGAKEIKAAKPDGIILSDGPGDPHDYSELVETAKALQKLGLPLLGIGLGHQLIALANGFEVVKMPFGHHGNHPVKDLATDKVFATAPNQNYTVNPASVKDSIAKIAFVNMHDRTAEGLEYAKSPTLGLQFYPDFVKGGHNASFLWNRFYAMTDEKK